ncbi:MAG: leucine-rich repeat domain-containing protein [Paludibacteraceae bacterium]|nr:leucine-rich repeat domain-containing protein [Paludibacteraceae bacterium]
MKRRIVVLLLLALALGVKAGGYVCVEKGGLRYTIVSEKYKVASVVPLDQQANAVLQRAEVRKHIWYKGRRYKVMIIADGAFGGCWQLRQVRLPDCVTTIGKGSFAWCIGLEEITLPASVCVIGTDAFSSCPELKAIYVPKEHVERIQQLLPKELRYLVKESEYSE